MCTERPGLDIIYLYSKFRSKQSMRFSFLIGSGRERDVRIALDAS